MQNSTLLNPDTAKTPSFFWLTDTGHISHFFNPSQVMILITGAHKAFALYKAIEEGVNHMWTVSAFQQHPQTVFVCDEDATLELRVKTVKYFQGDSKFKMLQCLNGYFSLAMKVEIVMED